MSGENTNTFNKHNIDYCLNELAKEYKKLTGRKIGAEIILIGGAAIIENYGFREMTTDVDAIITAESAMKDAINRVGDRLNLPNGWMNNDFQKTESYSSKIFQYSTFYKTFNQVLNVRVITGEYLIAMKLRAFRQYKNDLSDIIGILFEHNKKGDKISFEQINKAVIDLYGSWEGFPKGAKDYIEEALSSENYEQAYVRVRQNEKSTKNDLVGFEENYPGTLKTDNIDAVLQSLRAKKRNTDDRQR